MSSYLSIPQGPYPPLSPSAALYAPCRLLSIIITYRLCLLHNLRAYIHGMYITIMHVLHPIYNCRNNSTKKYSIIDRLDV